MRHTLDEVLNTFQETMNLQVYTVRETIDCDGYMSNHLALLFSGCNVEQIRGDKYYSAFKDWIVESVNWDDSQLKCYIMIGEC